MAEFSDLTIVDASNTARFPENMAPSAVNDGARALEGILARGLKDTIDGYVTTAGTSTAFTVAAQRTISAYYDGLTQTVEWHTASGAAPTLNIDSVGAKKLTWPDATSITVSDLIAGARAIVQFDSAADTFQVVTGNPATVGRRFLDEDDLTSNDSLALASQQSIKAYVDASVPGVVINVQSFTGSGTWTKPTGASKVFVQAWGAGGSGGTGASGVSNHGGGGGGGGYTESWFAASVLGATETVTIGSGGAAQASTNSVGNAGGNTTFGSWLTGYGGGAGGTNSAGGGGGGGAGAFAVGSNGDTTTSGAAGGAPGGGAAATASSSMGGGGGGGNGNAASTPGKAWFGGAGGGGARTGSDGNAGGASQYGGGGGGGARGDGAGSGGAGGASIIGGDGGAGATGNVAATAGTQPGGGGGGSDGGSSGAGGDGQVIVTTFISA